MGGGMSGFCLNNSLGASIDYWISLLVQVNGLYESLDSRISSLEKLKQTETSKQVEATE